MGAKLIKTGVNYLLEDDKGVVIASTSINKEGLSLSLKNCQAIERGYDLEELAELSLRRIDGEPVNVFFQQIFKLGFRKALELNTDKRFTLKEMVDCWNKALTYQDHKETLGEHIKSLQQTEWDVEIEMEYIGNCNGNNDDGCFMDSPGHNCGCFERKPKLDENNCLILKRV
jgi:hypothetical protein